MKTNNSNRAIAFVRSMMVMACALIMCVLTSCGDEPTLNNRTDINGGTQPAADKNLTNVWLDYQKYVSSNTEVVSNADGVTTLKKSYNFEAKFIMTYANGTSKDSIAEYVLTHTFVIKGMNEVMSCNDIKEIANQSFDITNGTAQIGGKTISTTNSRDNKQIIFKGNGKIWVFDTQYLDNKGSWNENNTRYDEKLLSNIVTSETMSFGNATKVEGTDNTYNLTATFTAKVNLGDAAKTTFSTVATTSEKDEVAYRIVDENIKGNVVYFIGEEVHTLHPELNKREQLQKEFNVSLRAGELIKYNGLESVVLTSSNANVFNYNKGTVTLNATYPNEVTLNYQGVTKTVAIPTPDFKEKSSNASASEDSNNKYLNTTKTYGMSWGGVEAATAVQLFQGWTEKEKDVVTVEIEYTENNGVINGKLWERHTIGTDKVLFSFSANRNLTVSAESLISKVVEDNVLTRQNTTNGTWNVKSSYTGNNVKGQTMSAVYTVSYNHGINNQVTVTMNRNLYVEYNGKKYEIANPNMTLSASNPKAGTTSENTKYNIYNWSVVYTATAGMQATATQGFELLIEKPDRIFDGWEVDPMYTATYAETNSYSFNHQTIITVQTLVWRNLNDHSQKKIASFEVINGVTNMTPIVEENVTEADITAALTRGKFFSVLYAKDANNAAAMLDVNTGKDKYKEGFAYVKAVGAKTIQGFDPYEVNRQQLGNPFKQMITKNADGSYGEARFF